MSLEEQYLYAFIDLLKTQAALFSDEDRDELAAQIAVVKDDLEELANLIITLDDLKDLNPDGFLLPNQIKASLGQTLILFAQPIGTTEYQELANNCLNALFPTGTQKILNYPLTEGKFLGSPIFQYENSIENIHI